MKVRIKKLDPNAVIPHYAHPTDAGLDLTATSMDIIRGAIIYGTGLAIEIPEGYVGLLFPRSSIYKTGLHMCNSVGIIDAGYRGEIKATFRTDFFDGGSYQVGDRIAQLIILPYPQVELIESDSLSDTDRGQGGFGSTGK